MMTRSARINKATPLPGSGKGNNTNECRTHESRTAMIHTITTSAPEVICVMKQKGLQIHWPPRLAGQPEMPDNNPFIWQLIFAIDAQHSRARIRRTINDCVTVTDEETSEWCLYFVTHQRIHSRWSNNEEVAHWPDSERKGYGTDRCDVDAESEKRCDCDDWE